LEFLAPEPQDGAILVDGAPVERASIRRYRRLFGYVPQSIFLIDDTVARNVAFGVGDDEIDVDAVKRACEQAQIADFIENELPQGTRRPLVSGVFAYRVANASASALHALFTTSHRFSCSTRPLALWTSTRSAGSTTLLPELRVSERS